MKYIELTIETSEAGIEPVTAGLMALGIEDMQIDDPADVREMLDNKTLTEYSDPGDFDDELAAVPSVTVYFNDDVDGRADAGRVKAEMKRISDAARRGDYGDGVDPGTLEVKTRVSDDAEWKDKWKAYIRPVRIGKSIVVRPSWVEYVPEDSDVVIEIDPGMAFGTGTHATTMLSGELLGKYMKRGDRVMDVGCGTGILSIIAAKLGASDVLGIDIDRDAVEVAACNIRKNNSAGVARAVYGDLAKGVDYKADVIVANLLAGLVIDLAADAAKHLRAGGMYITSGILIEQKEKVSDFLRSCGFDVLETAEMGEWCGIAAERR